MKEELGLKLGTPEEVYWTERKVECEKVIGILEKELKMNHAIMEMLNAKIAVEQEEERDAPDSSS